MDTETTPLQSLKLFMLMIGATPPGRHTEQHDIFFAIGTSPKDLIPEISNFWPEAVNINRLHVDAWREVTNVDGFAISVVEKTKAVSNAENTLFFVNLGGYTRGVFDEQHYKILSVNPDKASATANAKNTLFYEQTQFPGASSHIDDQYAIDVDDLYAVEDILSTSQKEKYSVVITKADGLPEDEIHLGYFKLHKLP